MKKAYQALYFTLALTLAIPGFAQVSIAPTSIFMDVKRIASLYITNPSEVA